MVRGRTSIGSLLAASVLAATLASCTLQAAEEMIEAPAADMNLTPAEIGSEFELISDEGLSEFGDSIDAELREPMIELNRRMFGGSDRMVWSWVVTYATAPTPAGAYGDLAIAIRMSDERLLSDAGDELCRQFGLSECRTTEAAPEGLQTGHVPSDLIDGMGQEFGMATNFVRLGGPDDTVRGYSVVFRQANVVGVLEVFGLGEALEQGWVENLARTLETKIMSGAAAGEG